MLVLDDYEENESAESEEERKQREEEKRRKKEENKKKKEEKKKRKEEEKKQREKEVKEIVEDKKVEEKKEEKIEVKAEKKKKEIKEEPEKIEEKVVKKEKVKREKTKSHKFRNFMIFLIFLMFAGAATLGLLYFMSPYKLELNGEKEIEVSYGSVYEEQGAVLKRFIFVSSKTIEVDGEIDTSKPGTYKITYTSDGMSVTRLVHVVDNEEPEILFDEDETFILNVNGNLDDLEVRAYDKYDEDIDNVEIEGNVDIHKLGEYEVKYKACDSSLNCSTKIRKVIVKDAEAPVIKINKGDLSLTLGEEKYEEYGATAEDNYDNNLGEIKIEGKVDSNKEGTYEIKYSICDSSENCSEAIRKVVVKKIDILHGEFESYPEFDETVPAKLSLNGVTKKATLTVNYCEGLGDIYGSYSVTGSKLYIKLDNDWYGERNLIFAISGNNKLKLETDFTACSPRQNEIFTRI